MAIKYFFMGISHQQDTPLRGAAARTRPACCWFAVERVCKYNRVSLGAMHCIVRMPTLSLTPRTTTLTIGAHKSVWARTRRLQTYSALMLLFVFAVIAHIAADDSFVRVNRV